MFDITRGRSIAIVTQPVTVSVCIASIWYWACLRAFSLSVIICGVCKGYKLSVAGMQVIRREWRTTAIAGSPLIENEKISYRSELIAIATPYLIFLNSLSCVAIIFYNIYSVKRKYKERERNNKVNKKSSLALDYFDFLSSFLSI